ncbi:MAG: flavin reductase family protein [Syntrophaceae bacterium]|nr:flavin reductase family protein [Syntrophaceae bacterium]
MTEMKEFEGLQKFMKRIEEGAFLVVKGKEKTNVMTIGWALIGVVWRRPVMMVAVRTSRFTHQLIEKADSFTVTLPSGDRKKEINLCGSKSGRDLDKFKECGFSAAKSRKVATPVLEIPGSHFECRMIHKAPINPQFLAPDLENLYPAKDYHTLYFGEILASYQT